MTRKEIFNRSLRWLPAAGMMAAIFVFSSIPSAQMPNFNIWNTLVKKGGHMLGYAMLALSIAWGLGSKPKTTWLAFGLAVIYAISDEYHQTFVPGRNGTPVDVAIDSLGASLGLLFRIWTKNRINRKH